MSKVKFGICNVHRSKLTFDENGMPAFSIPKALPGAKTITLDPEGSTSKFYADNMVYYTSVSNNGYAGGLEVAIVPDDFYLDHLGNEEIDNLIVEVAGNENAPFALLFQFEGDTSAKRHILYNCTASRPKLEGKTVEEEKTPDTDNFDFSAAPIKCGDKFIVKANTTEKTDKVKYDGWFTTAPTLPGTTTEAQG